MSTRKLKNISIIQFRKFLRKVLCEHAKYKGGHEFWKRSDLNRHITFQSHIDPIPEFIIKNNLRILGMNKSDFFDILEDRKFVKESNNGYIMVDKK